MLPPPQNVTAPIWLWKAAGWIVGGLITLLTTVLGYFGKKHIDRREQRLERIGEKVEQLETVVRNNKEQLHTDHGEVSGGLQALRNDLQDIKQVLSDAHD